MAIVLDHFVQNKWREREREREGGDVCEEQM
jgi:hypothetical protein